MHRAIRECKNLEGCIPRMNYDFIWHLFKRKLSINKYIEMRFCQIRRELSAMKNWLMISAVIRQYCRKRGKVDR